MTPRTVRAASSSSVMWAGAGLVFVGVFTALYGVALLVRGELLGAVLVALLGLLVIAAGAGLFLIARRATAHLDARGVSWSTMFGARGFVPWEQVHRVVVPGMGEPGDAVLLWLRDGTVVPIAPLRKTQSADDSPAAHPWYLRAVESVVRAHQEWLARQSSQGR